MLRFTFLFLCEFQDCGDKFHQPGNEHFALTLTSGCYDYCAYILQQAVVSEVIIYSRLFILFTLQSGNIHNIHKLIVGLHAMDGQSPSKGWWLLEPKNGLNNKSSKITHPFQMNPYWPGKKTLFESSPQEKWTWQASKCWKVQWWGHLPTCPSTR